MRLLEVREGMCKYMEVREAMCSYVHVCLSVSKEFPNTQER